MRRSCSRCGPLVRRQEPVLRATEEYYRRKSQQWLQSDSVPEYLLKVRCALWRGCAAFPPLTRATRRRNGRLRRSQCA